MECGQQVSVRDVYHNTPVRFIAQCHGRFLLVGHHHPMNGFLMPDWHAVLRELVALTVPAALVDKTNHVESTAGGMYTGIPLAYPLSARGLADVLGVTPEEVNEQLADLKVEAT